MSSDALRLCAAEALLQLHLGRSRHSDIAVEIDGAATLRVRCRPTSGTPKTTCEQKTLLEKDFYQNVMNKSEIRNDNEKDALISVLNAKINSLENQLKAYKRNPPSSSTTPLDPNVASDLLLIKHNPSSCNTISTTTSAMDSQDELSSEDNSRKCKGRKQHSALKSKNMVAIGEGHALVPASAYNRINWNSYTGATRKLLDAVFTRRILATHSLTGKRSPAFPNKPAKKRLDADLVNDIVQTVVTHCGVPESVVRTSITTKCADECKLYRREQQQRRNKQRSSNTENTPPGQH